MKYEKYYLEDYKTPDSAKELLNRSVETVIEMRNKELDFAILEFLEYYLNLPKEFICEKVKTGKLRIKYVTINRFPAEDIDHFIVKGKTVLVIDTRLGGIVKVWERDL